MGIFQQMTTVFNRAPVPLRVRFDGQELDVPPGLSQIPTITISFAKNQNPVMGQSDPYNPHISGGKYLIVEPGYALEEDQAVAMTPEEWATHLGRPCRVDEVALYEDKLAPGEKLVVRGRPRRPAAKSLHDQHVKESSGGDSVFSGPEDRA